MAEITKQEKLVDTKKIDVSRIRMGEIKFNWNTDEPMAQYDIQYAVLMPNNKRVLNELANFVDKVKRSQPTPDSNWKISINVEALPENIMQFVVIGKVEVNLEEVNRSAITVVRLTTLITRIGCEIDQKYWPEGILRS